MSGLTIRSGLPTDIPAIISFQKQIWWVTYEHIIGKEQCDFMFNEIYSEDSLGMQMSVLNHCFLLLELKGELLGFASFSEQREGKIFQLHKIYVGILFQGKGVGKLLLTAVETHARLAGAMELRLNVNRNNRARFFYEKMGFIVLFEENVAIGSYWMNDYVMGKRF